MSWFVVDKRTNEIVNAVECSGAGRPDVVLQGMVDSEHMELVIQPSAAQLAGYRYWNERP